MLCNNCGQEIGNSRNEKFCKFCGALVSDAGSEEKQKKKSEFNDEETNAMLERLGINASDFSEKNFVRVRELANDFYEGEKREKNDKYVILLEHWAAQNGYVRSQRAMGNIYFNGLCGIEEDDFEAKKWFLEAAKGGDKQSKFQLGEIEYFGVLGEKDYYKAFEYYQEAADEILGAKVRLGDCFSKGRGVEKDFEQSYFWYQKAAEEGDRYAQYELARQYWNGLGVPINTRKAFEWTLKSATNGDADAQFLIARCYHTGDEIEQNYKEAYYWYKAAMNQGHLEAQTIMGDFLLHGRGCERNRPEGFNLIKDAVDKGYKGAIGDLAQCYAQGWGIEPNVRIAEGLFLEDIENGNEDSLVDLAQCYLWWSPSNSTEQEFKKKVNQGFEILNDFAYNKNNGKAFMILAMDFDTGLHHDKDYDKAVELYKLAIQHGCNHPFLEKFKKNIFGKYEKRE